MSGSRIKLLNAQPDKSVSKPAAGGGFRAGAELREARERLGWDLGEVAAALRIKLAYLQAIEDGRVAALPGNAYALGFLRTYATTLGLDADEVSRRFRAEAGDINRRTELAFPAPAPERGVPTGALVLVGLLIAAVGYGAWYKLSDREQAPTHIVPAVPDSLLPARRAAPVSPQVASVLPPSGSAVPALPPRSVPAPAPAVPAPQADTRAAAPVAGAVGEPATGVPPAGTPTPMTAANNIAPALSTAPALGTAAVPATAALPSSAPSAPGGAAAASPGLVLHATAVTWVQVRAADHHVVWDHVMQPGDTWTVPADSPGLLLTTGNAGGLTLTDNGRDLPPLGRTGTVRRNLPLEAASVDAMTTAPAAIPAGSPPGATPSTATTVPATTPPGATTSATATTPPVRATHSRPRHAVLPPPGSADDSADQLNARELGH